MTWKDEIRSALKSTKELSSFFNIEYTHDFKDYPVFIPKNFADHIKASNCDALKNQFLPSMDEYESEVGFEDPIGDEMNSIDGGIIHRYQNRILYSPTTKCPINCRYCFRKNELHSPNDVFKSSLSKLNKYLAKHSEVSEVILTGGDPFFCDNKKLYQILETICSSEHIKHIRFHSRFPIIIPSRFDDELKDILAHFSQIKKILIAIHANHLHEFNNENSKLLKELGKINITLLSQSVLLRGVNDDPEALIDLYNKFDELGVRAYYLHHPDIVKGAMNFHLTLEQGRLIYSALRDRLSGWLIPHYIIDNNHGQGKQFAFNPETLKFSGQLLDKSNNTIRI